MPEHPLLRAARADAFAGLLDQAFPPAECELEREQAIEARMHASIRGVEFTDDGYQSTPLNPHWCAACHGYPVPHTNGCPDQPF